MQTLLMKVIEDPISFFGVGLTLIAAIFQLLKVFYLKDLKSTVEKVTALYAEKVQEDFMRICMISIGLTIFISAALVTDTKSILIFLGNWLPFIIIIFVFIAFLIQTVVYLILSDDRWNGYSARTRYFIQGILTISFLLWILSLFASSFTYYKDVNAEYYSHLFFVLLINVLFLQLSITNHKKITTQKMQYRIENLEQDEVNKKLKEMYIVSFLDSDKVLLSENEEENVHYKKPPYYIYIISSNSIQVIRDANDDK